MSLYVCETKTSSEDIGLGSVFWQRTRIDIQNSMYIAALRALGHDVLGVIYDAIRKPDQEPLKATPPESRKYTKPTKNDPVSRLYANQRETDETPEEYGARCLAAIVANPEKFYQRGVVTRLESERYEAAQDIWQTAQTLRDARRLKVFPRNPDACMQWSRACDYLSVCCGEASIDDPVLFQKEEKKHTELDGETVQRCLKCDAVLVGSIATLDGLVDSHLCYDCWLRTPGWSGVDVAQAMDRLPARALELLTQSSLRTFRSCHRKYFYRYEEQIRPLKLKAEPLRQGSSIHNGVEVLAKTGSLQLALDALDKEDPYANAKERSMLTGYYARWGPPTGVIAVEKEWTMDLVNPETGAKSKTFRLGGKIDRLVEVGT
jgi:hypothetical protein